LGRNIAVEKSSQYCWGLAEMLIAPYAAKEEDSNYILRRERKKDLEGRNFGQETLEQQCRSKHYEGSTIQK
jgi:hypothetical protein